MTVRVIRFKYIGLHNIAINDKTKCGCGDISVAVRVRSNCVPILLDLLLIEGTQKPIRAQTRPELIYKETWYLIQAPGSWVT